MTKLVEIKNYEGVLVSDPSPLAHLYFHVSLSLKQLRVSRLANIHVSLLLEYKSKVGLLQTFIYSSIAVNENSIFSNDLLHIFYAGMRLLL